MDNVREKRVRVLLVEISHALEHKRVRLLQHPVAQQQKEAPPVARRHRLWKDAGHLAVRLERRLPQFAHKLLVCVLYLVFARLTQPLHRVHGACEMKVCGLDSEPIGDAEVEMQNRLVARHMQGLQRKFQGQRVRYISLVEGNMSWVVANQIAMVMNEFQPMMHACKDDSKKVVGVMTTEEVKINMVNTTRALMQQKKLAIEHELVCVGKRRGLQGEARTASVGRLLGDQLKRLQQRIKSAKDVFGKSQSRITGKVGAHQDDLAIAFLFGVHWAMAHATANRLPLRAL